MTDELRSALDALSAATTNTWNNLDAPPTLRWCAALLMESHAAVLRELQCRALRDACADSDDTAVAVAAREYMRRKALHHMMVEARKGAQEITAGEWTEWSIGLSGMKVSKGEQRKAAMSALEWALAMLTEREQEGGGE